MAITSEAAHADRESDLHPGWAAHGIAAGALLLTAWEFSSPGARLWMWLILLVLWGGLAAYWALGLPAAIIERHALPSKSAWSHWLVLPAIAAVTVAFWYSSVPLNARFVVSRPAMNDLAAELLASPDRTTAPNQRLGLYWAKDIEQVRGTVRFHVASSGFGNNAGFAYSPAGAPPQLGEDSYWHLEGPWYLWEESW